MPRRERKEEREREGEREKEKETKNGRANGATGRKRNDGELVGDGEYRMRQPERFGVFLCETFSFLLSFIFISETDRVPVQIAFRPAYLAVAPRAHIFN